MLSRPYRIVLSFLLFLTSIALLPFELMHAGVAPVWVRAGSHFVNRHRESRLRG